MKFNGLVPELSVEDIEKSKEFYIDILGFKLEYERIEDKFEFISFEEAQIMIEEINEYWNTATLEYPFGRGINFQINVSSVDGIISSLNKNNVEVFRDVKINTYEGDGEAYVEKEILVQDPDGYLLRFSQIINV
ncbi:aldoketomutase [Clostridium botulinum]|uniref:bleomycin resistance protein n=1 Tax=Clostridium botulinum TaxID=1491 RepID=UPI000174EC8C|nr:VOC family protein [Clostridium botulinum]ACD53303.1 glyoxalase/bleomycin resistance protein/dioxygenase [Clostridium botulinum E3 str. Alaska E43]AJF29910.1 aldoketomutase [Clostridium botulinum]AJF32972.1 aldoketomutase [Clostridium botulinum]MBY6788910.1 VOC family protein [Clostridium botulinum]MBY6816663.1 VOC family protein [Clostridium botulinum]